MEILGIGPSELLFIVVLAIIILGPRDMQKAGRSIGRWLRQVVTSDGWKFFQQTSREIQTLPNRLMRESALEELKRVEQGIRAPGPDDSANQAGPLPPRAASETEGDPGPNRIAPPLAAPPPAQDPKENA